MKMLRFFGAITSLSLLLTLPASGDPKTGSGITVLDADNNVLGTLVGMSPNVPIFNSLSSAVPNGVIVYKNGYFITVDFSGKFPVASSSGEILWTSSSTCSGAGYLNLWTRISVIGTKIVIYSGQTNSLYVPSGTDASVTSIFIAGGIYSAEQPGLSDNSRPDGSSMCTPNISLGPGAATVWLLSPFDASVILGWKVSGNPLGVAGPIKFKDNSEK